MSAPGPAANSSHGQLMDTVYRNQRYIYDITRKYYLLGRDRLIAELAPPDDGTVIEMACGTGRNLIRVARAYPTARIYGMDISAQMLATARTNIARAGLSDRITLAEGDACAFDAEAAFGVAHFDRVFLSYSVSMIPDWTGALDQALRLTGPQGSVHVVDFGEQSALPASFGKLLRGWLARFHVAPRADLEAQMRTRATDAGATLRFASLYRDYARYGVIHRS